MSADSNHASPFHRRLTRVVRCALRAAFTWGVAAIELSGACQAGATPPGAQANRPNAVESPRTPARAGTVPSSPRAPEAGTTPAEPGHAAYPPTGSASELRLLAAESLAAGRPMVVMFSLRGCPWCDALRREHFAGLIAAQQQLGILAVEVDMTDSRAFASPQQVPTPASLRADSPRDLSRHYRVRLAPTVLFLGPQGEVADRLVGYGSPDFFGAYLEQRIAQARSALQASQRTPTQ
ncbi:MAG: thioredoxin fold domain-containing protein [Betaproteobacteria bacterium]